MPPRRRSLAVAWVLAFAAFLSLHPSTSIAARAGGDSATSSANPSVPRGLVVVLRPPELTETMRVVLARITGELAAASFQVRVESLDLQKDPTQQIQAAALEADAVAAFALGSNRDSLAIWIFERLGSRTTIQRVPVRPGGFAKDAKVAALKAVELIRASLADLWPAPATAPAASPGPSPLAAPSPPASPPPAPPAGRPGPAAPPIAPTSPAPPPASAAPAPEATGSPPTIPPPLQPEAPPSVVEPPSQPATPREPAGAPPWPPSPGLAVALGVASLWDLQSTPQWMGSLQVERRFNARLAVQARVAGLGTSLAIAAPYGSTSLERERGSLGAAWAFWSGTRAYASVVAALGVDRVTAAGRTNDPTRPAQTTTGWLPIALGGLSATVRLAPHWSVVARLEAEWAWSRLDVEIGETRTQPLVRPGALSELSLQASF